MVRADARLTHSREESVNTSRYSVLIAWSNEDRAYVVSFPEWEAAGLIGHAHGETYAEAVRNGEEPLQFLLESAHAEGDPIPEPRRFAASA